MIKQAIKKSWRVFRISIPITVGILLIINLLNVFLQDWYGKIFTGNALIDPLIGALAGSVSFGIPLTSYIIGGELLLQGVSLLAVAAFIMAWATVGVAMLPLEAMYLGKHFAFARNGINFIFSIIIAILTIYTLNIFNGI
ncbi:hypothetical protein J7J13_01180 [bacterium]|nr:hypothetical protein [bacterium]